MRRASSTATVSAMPTAPITAPSRNRIAQGVLMAAAAALALSSAHAADKPKEAGFGKGKATGAFLTKEQLRTCLSGQTLIAQRDAELLNERAEFAAAKAEIARSGDDLKQRLETLDRSNLEAVTAHNIRSAARDKSIDDLQARVPPFNAKVEAAQADREAHAKGCENRRYFEEDETAIRKGK